MSAPLTPVRHRRVLTRIHGYSRMRLHLHVLHRCGDENAGPFLPLVWFFVARGAHRNLTLQRTYTTSVGLLLDFLAERGVAIEDASAVHLQEFVDRLVCGPADVPGFERAGRRGRPLSPAVVKGHLERINRFADWLATRRGQPLLNPWQKATAGERRLRLQHLGKRTIHALLGHAVDRRNAIALAGLARAVTVPERNPLSFDDVLAFDREQLPRLIEAGWRFRPDGSTPPRPQAIRNVLITILLHAGGLRRCEPFHLFTEDVVPHPTKRHQALIWMYHPERGKPPYESGTRWRDREHLLRDLYHLQPRTLEHGRFHAGWKNVALTDAKRMATTVSILDEEWARTFWKWYLVYLQLRGKCAHPFLFVSHRGPQRGCPYTVDRFSEAHAVAMARCGFEVGKRFGTTPHGHRHAYGAALTEAGVEPRIIRRAMHHHSLQSQERYKTASAQQVAKAFEGAHAIGGSALPQIKGE